MKEKLRCFIICTAYIALWTLLLTPAVLVMFGLAYGMKKFAENKKARRKQIKAVLQDKEI